MHHTLGMGDIKWLKSYNLSYYGLCLLKPSISPWMSLGGPSELVFILNKRVSLFCPVQGRECSFLLTTQEPYSSVFMVSLGMKKTRKLELSKNICHFISLL
jgi:hypothetical protein